MSIGAVNLFKQLAQNDFGFFQKVTEIGDLMTASPRSLSLDDTLEDALKFFRINDFHHAPVMEPESGELVGILSDRDVLRFRPARLGTLTEREEDEAALRTPVAQMMTRSPFHVPITASPVQALSLMIDHHIDCVLVFEDRKEVQGILTPRDFAKTLLLFRQICRGPSKPQRMRLVDLDLDRGIPADYMFSLGAKTVRDVMTNPVTTVNEGQTIDEAVERMQSQAIRHLPVIDSKSQLIGLVTDREILGRMPTPTGPKIERTDHQRFRDILFAEGDPESLRDQVSRVMITDPTTVTPVTYFDEAMELFQDGVSGLPVVDETEGRVCGIITLIDLLRVCRAALLLGANSSC